MTESPKELAREAQSGHSERTPAIAISGVTVGVGAFVLLVMAIALILYYVV